MPTGAFARASTALLVVLAAALLMSTTACSAGEAAGEADYPWLSGLDADDPFPSGERLVALDHGLHALETNTKATQMLVAVHGWHSRGYEWVHLLKTLDDPDTSVWFYRWNDDGCPQAASDKLLEYLQAQITQHTAKVHLFGHSYGGLVLADVLNRWSLPIPVDVHIVASPLGSTGASERCGYQPPTAIGANVKLFQWRTQWHLDGAFKDMPFDPQIIELPGNRATRLPSEYNGNRLGHNRSLSWVADHVARQRHP